MAVVCLLCAVVFQYAEHDSCCQPCSGMGQGSQKRRWLGFPLDAISKLPDRQLFPYILHFNFPILCVDTTASIICFIKCVSHLRVIIHLKLF